MNHDAFSAADGKKGNGRGQCVQCKCKSAAEATAAATANDLPAAAVADPRGSAKRIKLKPPHDCRFLIKTRSGDSAVEVSADLARTTMDDLKGKVHDALGGGDDPPGKMALVDEGSGDAIFSSAPYLKECGDRSGCWCGRVLRRETEVRLGFHGPFVSVAVDLDEDTVFDLKVKAYRALRGDDDDAPPPDVAQLTGARFPLKKEDHRTLRDFGVDVPFICVRRKSQTRATMALYHFFPFGTKKRCPWESDDVRPIQLICPYQFEEGGSINKDEIAGHYDIIWLYEPNQTWPDVQPTCQHKRPLGPIKGATVTISADGSGGPSGSVDLYPREGHLSFFRVGRRGGSEHPKVSLSFRSTGDQSRLTQPTRHYPQDGIELRVQNCPGRDGNWHTVADFGRLCVMSERANILRHDIAKRGRGGYLGITEGVLVSPERASALMEEYERGRPKHSFLHLKCRLPEDVVTVILDYIPRMEPPPVLFVEKGDLFLGCTWYVPKEDDFFGGGFGSVEAVSMFLIARRRKDNNQPEVPPFVEDPPHPSLHSTWLDSKPSHRKPGSLMGNATSTRKEMAA